MRLRLDNLSKGFASLRGRVQAVQGVSLEIEAGEFFVLLGPSGSGKSTLLNLIAGLERPTGGRIWFGERPMADPAAGLFVPPRPRNVAMVFQTYALYPHLSVFENIAFPLRVGRARTEDIEARVRAAAESVKILDLLKARPAELSGGQRQRTAIARAIVRRPEVLLLDEPLSNLDARLRASTRVELKRLQRRLNLTTVYVTHDQVEAMTLGDRIGLLNQGRLEQVGRPEELYRRPANPFAATFIGSPAMNLLEARVEERGEGLVLLLAGQAVGLAKGLGPPEGLDRGRLLVGLRPEDIGLTPGPAQAAQGPVLRGRIASLEPLGRETLVRVSVGDEEIVALTSARDLQVGAPVSLELDPARLHFFNS